MARREREGYPSLIQREKTLHPLKMSDSARGCIDDMSEFANLLRESGLSKRRLAELCGVHEDTVSRWGDDAPRYAITILRYEVWRRRGPV